MKRDPVALPRVGLVQCNDALKFPKVSSTNYRDFVSVVSGCFIKHVDVDSRDTKDAW